MIRDGKVDERTGSNNLINPADIRSLPDLWILRGLRSFSVILSYDSLMVPLTAMVSPARRRSAEPSDV